MLLLIVCILTRTIHPSGIIASPFVLSGPLESAFTIPFCKSCRLDASRLVQRHVPEAARTAMQSPGPRSCMKLSSSDATVPVRRSESRRRGCTKGVGSCRCESLGAPTFQPRRRHQRQHAQEALVRNRIRGNIPSRHGQRLQRRTHRVQRGEHLTGREGLSISNATSIVKPRNEETHHSEA